MESQEQVRRALSGDRNAIDALIRMLTPVVQARVATALWTRGRASRQELEDLTQDVLVRLFTGEEGALASWDPERGLSLQGFVGLLTERFVLTVLRSQRRNPFTQRPVEPGLIEAGLIETSAGRDDAQDPPDGPVAAREFLRLLLDRLKLELSPKGLEMFHRLYVLQQPPELIARETQSKLEAIYQWRSRLGKLTRELEQQLLREGQPRPTLLTSSEKGSNKPDAAS